ncbi:GntR family transcriptional regulator [Advenella kashmirensis W13003]|uniref:GntR family transcriptional regulator n=1 Tax=Advenella kashmirensis W13003 TaxID=1424334 RepID=V8QNH8_9BURK|nr:PLP-dependent aminotransferase family protein [Advenella kashmirensis]ETF00893.1 GntR family transcriptional regulator [Advenella kashmirensis W13003]
MDLSELLKQRVLSGEWTKGQRLPSVRKMALDRGVSHHAVVCAYARLVSEGLIEAQQGRGYFVSNWIGFRDKPLSLSTSMAGNDEPLLKLLQAPPEQFKLGCGWLPIPWRDTDVFARAIRKVARSGQSALFEYGDIQGYLPLRNQLSVHLYKSTQIDISPNQILTTLGATQALDLASHLLIKPGDRVLVDEPCNANLIKLIHLYGGVPIGVPRVSDGPDVAVLDRLLQSHKIKAFYCNTNYHNPTGACLTPQVAFKVLKRAVEHDFIIVEDDVYGDFFAGPRQTFAQLDDMEHVIYINSFSKSLSASLRIGYMACSARLIEQLLRLKLLTSVAVPGFCERFVNAILVDGAYSRHIQTIQRQLMVRQKLTQKSLKKYGWEFEIEPDGGMFLWISHPDFPDLSPYLQYLEKEGILLMPGSAFSVAHRFECFARLNVAHFTREVSPFFDTRGVKGVSPTHLGER